MERRRFPIFEQLSDGSTPASRGLQVVSEEPQLVALRLQGFGKIELLQINFSSVTVIFSEKSSSISAYRELSQNHRVFFFSQFYINAHLLPKLTPSKLQPQNLFLDSSFSIPLQISDSLSSPSTAQSNPSSRQQQVEQRRKLRKKPVFSQQRLNYIVDLAKIYQGEDSRTTVMVKNIPNKYTQKMLLQMIDKHFAGQYDFLYLPIDFKNKCNVGYAFINFVEAQFIPAFYQMFVGKRWQRFNSEKTFDLAYARIQGKQALTLHFESSSVMSHEDSNVKPLIFKN